MDRKIQVVHLLEGHNIDKLVLMSKIEKFYDKLAKNFMREIFMEVHFKVYNDKGKMESKREQIETKIHVKAPHLNLNASETEWDAIKSLKKAFKAIEKEAEKALHKQEK
jgi:ribosome-associated translation inhibitor RaiA